MVIRLSQICQFFSLVAMAYATIAQASEFGRIGFSGNPETNGGAVCTACHSPNPSTPSVTITGPTLVNAGQTNTYTVTVRGGPGISAGVNISTTNFFGTLAPAGTDLRLIEKELTHSKPKTMVGGQATFTFRWTAPTFNTTLSLYAAGNSTNGGHNLLNDGIGKATLPIKVQNGTGTPPPPPPVTNSPVTLETYVTGLRHPVVITHAKDSRLFIVEQPGRIRISKAKGSVQTQPFLDISSRVLSVDSEQGLLGLAFHPNYAANGFFYVYYTRDMPGSALDRSRISRFQRSTTNPDLANPASEVVLLEFDQPGPNHNAGDLHFGKDGFLYIASGDGVSGGDINNNGQRVNTLLAKILRIDVNAAPGPKNGPDCDLSGKRNYRIPPSNAYTDGKAGQGCDEIYALGVRNPWRFSFDRKDGSLWIADVGEHLAEEINYIPAATGGGLNLGWRCFEGRQAFKPAGCNRAYLFPIYAYSHAAGNCSITGGYVYRGLKFPKLAGKYFFTDFCTASIRTLTGPISKPTVAVVFPAGKLFNPSTFGEDSLGEMYVADLFKGIIYRIVGKP